MKEIYEVIKIDFPALIDNEHGIYRLNHVMESLISIESNTHYTDKIREKANLTIRMINNALGIHE